MTDEKLLEMAVEMLNFSYVPYSHYPVGAALLGKDGKVYTGCNVENAAYGNTLCAERTALCKAISEGAREFVSIAVVGGKRGTLAEVCAPCGVCRQVMAEFCAPDFRILLGTPDQYAAYRLRELLPLAFCLKNTGGI
jgi:cytidine deaminase